MCHPVVEQGIALYRHSSETCAGYNVLSVTHFRFHYYVDDTQLYVSMGLENTDCQDFTTVMF